MTIQVTSKQGPRLRSFVAGCCVALSVVFGGCGSGNQFVPDPVLVVVGEGQVRVSDFMAASRARTHQGEFPRSGSGFEGFRDRVLWDLAFQTLLIQEADRRGVSIDDSDIQGARAALVAQGADKDTLDAHLVERFGSVEAWVGQIQRRLLAGMAEELLRADLLVGERFTPEEIAAGRRRFRANLIRPARIRATQFFSGTAEPLYGILQELGGGTPYEEVAAKHEGVDMGWMNVTEAPDLITGALEGLAAGKHTPILSSPLGHHIFVLTGRQPAARLSGETESVEIERLLREDAVDLAVKDWLGQRAEALQLSLHEGNVAEVRCCRTGLPYWSGSQPEVD